MRIAVMLLLCCLMAASGLAEEMPRVPELEPLPTSTEFIITAAGDCTLGGEVQTGIDAVFAASFQNNGAGWFFANVKALFEEDDVTLVNLEGPLTDSEGSRASKKYVMRGEPGYAQILTEGSVEVVNAANNHAHDFGDTGYADTLDTLATAGIGASGGDLFYTVEKDGYIIGFLGYEKWNYDADDAISGVKTHRDACDLLIVSMHWGEEYDYSQNTSEQKLGRALIDAGADLVIGTHPHVIQGIERYNGKYIVYSLGNFCFGGNTNPSDKDCYIFRQRFLLTQSGVEDGGIAVIPCSISSSHKENNYQPTPLTGDAAETLAGKIRRLSRIDGAVWLEE